MAEQLDITSGHAIGDNDLEIGLNGGAVCIHTKIDHIKRHAFDRSVASGEENLVVVELIGEIKSVETDNGSRAEGILVVAHPYALVIEQNTGGKIADHGIRVFPREAPSSTTRLVPGEIAPPDEERSPQ